MRIESTRERISMAPESDMAERMVRVETKLDFLIGQIDKLPPSPACVVKHAEIETRFKETSERIEGTETKVSSLERWQSRIIGVFLALNIMLVLAMEKIRHIIFGN